MPNLKIINLENHNNIATALQDLDEGSLNNLEEINLYGSTPTVEDITSLLKAAPSLSEACKKRLMDTHTAPKQTTTTYPNQDENPANSEQRHNPLSYKNFKPSAKDKPFQYTGTQDPRNQKMIIEKFSQYLIEIKERPNMAAKIQDGLCNALSYFFKDLATHDQVLEQWRNFSSHLTRWDGNPQNISTELRLYFDRLSDFVEEYQTNTSQIKTNFIGENLELLSPLMQSKDMAFILSNPWHSVCVRTLANETYQLYDPNNAEVILLQGINALKKQMVLSIGSLISVDHYEGSTPRIEEINRFLAAGGLFPLIFSQNGNELVSQIPLNFPFSQEALEGLLLRSTKGIPVWMDGLQSQHESVRTLTHTLLAQLQRQVPDAKKQLEQSAADIPPYQKHDTACQVIHECPSSNPAEEPLRELLLGILRQQKQTAYKQALSTWSVSTTTSLSIPEYCQQRVSALNPYGQKTQSQLIECQSTDQLQNMAAVLDNYCKHTSRPVFYIDSPEDLICSAAFVQIEPQNPALGHLQKGPGGPLHDFLKKHQTIPREGPVLIVNYERFKPDDVVRFNGLIDAKPNADGTDLPPNTVLIGLTNTESIDYYNGADFKSRFSTLTKCPFTAKQLLTFIPLTPITESASDAETTVINLYRAQDWKSRLLGRWIIEGQSLSYQAGELQKALLTGKPIEIQNGLWEEENFTYFWNKIRQQGIYHSNQWFHVPEKTSIVRSNGYDWQNLCDSLSSIQVGLSEQPTTLVLNSSTLNRFLGDYQVDVTSKSLQKTQGYLDKAKNKRLTVNFTGPLSPDNWAMLLSECSKRAITLALHCAPGVGLPKALNFQNQPPPYVSPWNRKPSNQAVAVIESSDPDTTVALLEQSKRWCVIDVSECQVSDLLLGIRGELCDKTSTPRFEFKQHNGALLHAQTTGQSIILKGHFSVPLVDGLAAFLLEKSKEKPPQGQLLIVSDKTDSFSFLTKRFEHQVTREEKIDCLHEDPALIEQLNAFIELESLSRLKTRAAFLKIQENPNTPSEEAWKGLRHLPQNCVRVAPEPLNLEGSAKLAHDFMAQRKAGVIRALSNRPCIFLAGLSGIGKTTFVERELCANGSGYQLFSGESQLQAWATDTSDQTKVLFLDEANLSPRQWSEFEGLLTQSPGILIGGTFYPLTEKHKVVFAGNPISYGDDRRLAPFFERHTATVLFEPLSKAVIHEKIIAPIFEGQALDIPILSTISNLILDAYALICQASTTDVLISPRELQMMALLAVCNYKNNPNIALITHVQEAIYEIGLPLIPSQNTPLLQQFKQQFKPTETSAELAILADPAFILTPSRQGISRTLQERLQLLNWRKTNEKTLNVDQKYGGLGGLILEGEPGIGKSELITHILTHAGYEKANYSQSHDATQQPYNENHFYSMPVSMSLDDKKALLLQAFNEGGIVIIDEINSSPMMEQFLNALLMGKNPNTGEPAKRVGFMVIGTQNPPTMAGRRIASTALQRRMTTLTVPEYNQAEMKLILLQKTLDADEADALIDCYLERRNYAKAKQLSPVPCFRDLLKLADAQKRASHHAPQTAVAVGVINAVAPGATSTTKQDSYLLMAKRGLTPSGQRTRQEADPGNASHAPLTGTQQRHRLDKARKSNEADASDSEEKKP